MLNGVTVTVILEGESTVEQEDVILSEGEEQARTFAFVRPAGYEDYTLIAKLQNSNVETFYIEADENDEIQLNADVMLAGELLLQVELRKDGAIIVDNTVFTFTVTDSVITDVLAETTPDILQEILDYIDYNQYPDKNGKAGLAVVVNETEDGFEYIEAGSGDMAKSVYDTDDDGTVNSAEQITDGVTSYTPSDIATALSGKANTVHTHTESDITDLDKYTQSEVDTLLTGKSDSSHTHVEADITDLGSYLTDAPVDTKQYARQDGSWTEVVAEANAVDSVNGQTGVVVLDSDDISEGSVNLYLTGNEFQKNVDTMDNVTNGTTYVKTTNDYTTAEKDKLAGIEEGAEVNTVDSVNGQTDTVVLDADDIDDTSTTNKFTNATDISRLANTSGTNTGDQSASDFNHNSLTGLNDGATYQHITTDQETNFEIAYSHTSLTDNPHSVTASQVGLGNVDNTSDLNKPISTATQTALNGKLDKTNTYYNNTGSGTAIYVRFAVIKMTGTYQKYRLMLNCGIGGNARDYGTIEVQIDGSSTYNTFLTSTSYTASSKSQHFANTTFYYKGIDNGADDYDIELWVKVDAYAKFHCTLVDTYTEGATVTYLPTSPSTSGTLPTGTTAFTYQKIVENKYYTEYTVRSTTGTTQAIGITYVATKDYISVCLNGEKLIKGVDYTTSDTLITFTSYTLQIGDVIHTEVISNLLL